MAMQWWYLKAKIQQKMAVTHEETLLVPEQTESIKVPD